MPRRRVMIWVCGAIVLLAASCTGQADQPGTGTGTSLPTSAVESTGVASPAGSSYFTITAAQGRLDQGLLTLSGVVPSVVVISDRPTRSVERIPLASFVAEWPERFASSAPNAVLSIVDGGTEQVVPVVVDTPSPTQPDSTFVAKVEAISGTLPSTLAGLTTLVIDGAAATVAEKATITMTNSLSSVPEGLQALAFTTSPGQPDTVPFRVLDLQASTTEVITVETSYDIMFEATTGTGRTVTSSVYRLPADPAGTVFTVGLKDGAFAVRESRNSDVMGVEVINETGLKLQVRIFRGDVEVQSLRLDPDQPATWRPPEGITIRLATGTDPKVFGPDVFIGEERLRAGIPTTVELLERTPGAYELEVLDVAPVTLAPAAPTTTKN